MENNTMDSKVTVEGVTPSKLEGFLKGQYEFRNNIVTGRIEVCPKGRNSKFTPINDLIQNSLYRKATAIGLKTSTDAIRTILQSDFSPRYDPFKSYLDGLEKWTQQDKSHIALVAALVKAREQEHWERCFKKWMVAMVASLYEDDLINHTVLVLQGSQGVGKTTFLLNLVPDELKEYVYSGTVRPGNKDTEVQLSECCLINLDELGNLNRRDLGSLKEMITKSSIKIRRPYGYYSENLIRRASFVGSVNQVEFLNDPTGSRRFLCFEAQSIDNETSINMGRVWAEALHLYKAGYQYWFDKAEINELKKYNEDFTIQTFEEEIILRYFKPCIEEDHTDIMNATEILEYLRQSVHPKINLNLTGAMTQRVGKVMNRKGFLRVKRKGNYRYLLRRVTATNETANVKIEQMNHN